MLAPELLELLDFAPLELELLELELLEVAPLELLLDAPAPELELLELLEPPELLELDVGSLSATVAVAGEPMLASPLTAVIWT